MTDQSAISRDLGQALADARRAKGLSQRAVARKVGRTQARVAELETSLKSSQPIRDRLSLLVDLCEALGVVPVLVPRSRTLDVRALIGQAGAAPVHGSDNATGRFDELFIELRDDEDM